jgi:hypothetical protein
VPARQSDARKIAADGDPPVRLALHGCFSKFHDRGELSRLGMASHLNDPRSMLIVHASDLTGDDDAAFLHAAAWRAAARD